MVAQEPSSGTAKGLRLAILLLLQVTEVVLDPVEVVGDEMGTLAAGARRKHLACGPCDRIGRAWAGHGRDMGGAWAGHGGCMGGACAVQRQGMGGAWAGLGRGTVPLA